MRCFALLWIAAAVAAGEETRPVAAPSVSREILELRLEVYRQGIEFQDWKILQLDAQLEHAVAQERRAAQEERALLDDLASPDGDAGELGGRKGDTSRVDLPRAQESRRLWQQRIGEMTGLMARERERREKLAQLAAQAETRLQDLDHATRKEIRK